MVGAPTPAADDCCTSTNDADWEFQNRGHALNGRVIEPLLEYREFDQSIKKLR